MGGILKHAAAHSAPILAPTVNSYKRLVRGRSAFRFHLGAGLHYVWQCKSNSDDPRTRSGAYGKPYGGCGWQIPYLACAAMLAAGSRRY